MAETPVVEVDDVTWEKQVEKTKKPVMVMFYSPTCPYCAQMEPYFNEYASEFKNKVVFAKINIMQSPTIAGRYGVMGTPSFKFFCHGRPIKELTGAMYPTLLKKAVEDTLRYGKQCADQTTWVDPVMPGYA
jgi:thioredoxin 1